MIVVCKYVDINYGRITYSLHNVRPSSFLFDLFFKSYHEVRILYS